MPLQTITRDGKTCYRWGDNGHVYCGPNGKEMARKQGQAIEINKHSSGNLLDKIIAYFTVKEEDEQVENRE